MDVADLFAVAWERHHNRDDGEAERLLSRILTEHPQHAPSLHLHGMIHLRRHQSDAAIILFERAIAAASAQQFGEYRAALAFALRRAGRLTEAEDQYRLIVESEPQSTNALVNLGIVLKQRGKPGQAERQFRAGIHLEPSPALYHLLGLSLVDQGRFEEAETACRVALAGDPNLAIVNTLGIAVKEQGRPAEAVAIFTHALDLRPDFAEALYNRSAAQKDEGRTDEAIAGFRNLLRIDPELAAARVALCMAHLPPLYRDDAEIERRRRDYGAELEALAAYADAYSDAALADGIGASQPFYLAYQGKNDVALQRRYGALVCRAMATRFPPVPLAKRPANYERVRVGIASAYFRAHANWHIPIRGWLSGLDPDEFELFAYHLSGLQDFETEQARKLCAHFVQGPHSVARWRELIVGDALHILIYPEVGMDPVAAQLAGLRLAPVQCNSWGHPTTSGYPTLDHFLSSDLMEPEDGDRHYSEHLVRLPGLSTTVDLARSRVPVPSRTELGLGPGSFLFWCGQSLYKYLPRFDGVFAAIAEQVTDCEFVFIEFPGSPDLTERFRQRLSHAFAERGMDASVYCRFLPRLNADGFAGAMGCADIVLDSIGWSGCNSLVTAIGHAIPIVTMRGNMMRGRHGAALLEMLGLGHMVCGDVEHYVAAAVGLAQSPDRRRAFAVALSDARESALQQTDPVEMLAVHLTRWAGEIEDR